MFAAAVEHEGLQQKIPRKQFQNQQIKGAIYPPISKLFFLLSFPNWKPFRLGQIIN